jgi:hypothetical protein
MTDLTAFTAESVYRILRNVTAGGGILPSSADPALGHMARYLNTIQDLYRVWKNPVWKDEIEEMRSAITVILATLPKWRNEHGMEAVGLRRWRDEIAQDPASVISNVDEAITELDRDVTALDALIASATAVAERGLPLMPAIIFSKVITHRFDFAEDLQLHFKRLFPKASDATYYKFFNKITKLITDKTIADSTA